MEKENLDRVVLVRLTNKDFNKLEDKLKKEQKNSSVLIRELIKKYISN